MTPIPSVCNGGTSAGVNTIAISDLLTDIDAHLPVATSLHNSWRNCVNGVSLNCDASFSSPSSALFDAAQERGRVGGR